MMATVVELAIQSTPCGIQKIRRWVAAGSGKDRPTSGISLLVATLSVM
jgi:hypothetical protein